MNYIAGVPLPKEKRSPSESSSPAEAIFARRSSVEGNINTAKAKEENSGGNPPAQAATSSGRSTRWSSALMSGADPRTLYANKKFSSLYDSWESSNSRKYRKSKPSTKTKQANIFPFLEGPNVSEDDEDSTVAGDRETFVAIISEIGGIVTTLIGKMRFAAEIPVMETEGLLKANYGTRATSAQLHQQRLVLTGGAPLSSKDIKTKKSGKKTVCDDMETFKGEVEDMVSKSSRIARGKKHGILPYYLAEYIALRAQHYYRVLRNMKRLEEHLTEYPYIPKEFIRSLIDIYRCAALGHLEALRRMIPKRTKRAGVLDFRAWRSGMNRVPVTMDHLHSLLEKYHYNRIRDVKFTPHSEMQQKNIVRRFVPPPENSMPPFSHKGTLGSDGKNSSVPVKGTTHSKEPPKANILPQPEPEEPVINREHEPVNPPAIRIPYVAKKPDPVLNPSAISEKELNIQKPAIPVPLKEEPLKADSTNDLFADEEDTRSVEAQKYPTRNDFIQKRVTPINTDPFPTEKSVANRAPEDGQFTKKPSYTRHAQDTVVSKSTSFEDVWKQQRIAHLAFDKAKPDFDSSIKIPRLKPKSEQGGTSSSHE